ncbi:MAG TPA: extracellular solute-binding protein [Candidatus Limihabitans stercoravium]|nr:extracellular solute-binding protein [Candidatus Limihabitans stercoravium]
MKKVLAIALVLVVLSATLVACGPTSSGKTEIVFYHTMGQNLRDVLDRYIVEFEKLYPQYDIQHKQVGGYEDVRDQVNSEIIAGKQPNIAYCYPDHVALYNIAGAVQTLDEYINSTEVVERSDGATEIVGLTDEQKADFIEGYYQEGAQFGDGKMYSMPFSKSTEVLYYNKTYFEENKLTVPTTWDEMEEVCAKIKEIENAKGNTDIIPLGYDSEDNWFITMCEQLNSGYTQVDKENTSNQFIFNNDANKEFVKKFSDWYAKGYVTTKALNGNAYTSDLFTKGKSMMCIGSSAGASNQIPDPVGGKYPFEADITSIPQIDPENPKVISQGPSVTILKNANKDEVLGSWLFVKFLTTNAAFQADFSIASGYVPVIKSTMEDPAFAEHLSGANGHEGLVALSSLVCMEQESAYYASPAFYGSSFARDEVGLLMQKCLVECSQNLDNLDAFLDQVFEAAVQNCIQAIS